MNFRVRIRVEFRVRIRITVKSVSRGLGHFNTRIKSGNFSKNHFFNYVLNLYLAVAGICSGAVPMSY